LQVVNSDQISPAARDMLDQFLRNTKAQIRKPSDPAGPWKTLDRLYTINRKYLAAAKLFDSGRRSEAAIKLDAILREQPAYPFALMLKALIQDSF
jgi:hypothetical protein